LSPRAADRRYTRCDGTTRCAINIPLGCLKLGDRTPADKPSVCDHLDLFH